MAVLVAMLCAVAAYFVSSSATPLYRARTTIVLATQTNTELRTLGVTLATAPVLDVNAYRVATLSDPVIATAMQSLGLAEGQYDPDIIRRQVNIRTEDSRNSSLIHIDVTDAAPLRAAELSRALAGALEGWDVDRAYRNLFKIVDSLTMQLAALDEQIRTLQSLGPAVTQDQIDARLRLRSEQQQQLYYARALGESAVGLLSIVQPAATPRRPVSPLPLRSAAMAFLLGLFLTYGLLLLKDSLNTRLLDVDDLHAVTGLPILAQFPKLSKGERRLPREAASYLRTNLHFSLINAHPKVILVTSPNQAEGKSSVAMSVAESFVRDNNKTLLIDADLRKPVLAREYSLNGKLNPSLSQYLENPTMPFEPASIAVSHNKFLDIVPTYEAASSPAELLGHGLRECLDRWRQQYDVIIIDSAPILPVADSLTIAPLCDGTVLISSLSGTERQGVKGASELLQRFGVRLLGVVATQVTKNNSASQYGYGYGYGYGASDDDSSPKSRPPLPVISQASAVEKPR